MKNRIVAILDMALTACRRQGLLTEAETCKFLGMSRPFLARARSEGRPDAPPFVKCGRAVRYDVRDLEAYLDANRHGGGSN